MTVKVIVAPIRVIEGVDRRGTRAVRTLRRGTVMPVFLVRSSSVARVMGASRGWLGRVARSVPLHRDPTARPPPLWRVAVG